MRCEFLPQTYYLEAYSMSVNIIAGSKLISYALH